MMMVSLLGCGSNVVDLRDKSLDSTVIDRNEEGVPLVDTYVKRFGSKYQLVNSYGMVISDSYDEIAPVIAGDYFWVRNGSQYGFIYKDGSLVNLYPPFLPWPDVTNLALESNDIIFSKYFSLIFSFSAIS